MLSRVFGLAPVAAARTARVAPAPLLAGHHGLFSTTALRLMQIQALDRQGAPVEHRPVPEFAALQSSLPGWLTEGVKSMNFVKPTDIQAHTIPFLLEGKDMIGLAPTGSGKTVAFALPSLAMIKERQRTPQVVVLCPVRELAQQTAKVFKGLCAHAPHVRVRECYGGAPRPPQVSDVQRGCDVLVATPGRLVDFLQAGVVSFEALRFIVFDEADRLLDMGFSQALDTIMSYTDRRAHCQTMMWSATWPEEVRRLADTYLTKDYVKMQVGDGSSLMLNPNITQKVFYCKNDDERMSQLAELYTSGAVDPNSKGLMFVLRKDQCEAVAHEVADGLNHCCGVNPRSVAALHGDMPQYHRDRVIANFKDGRVKVLVATDVAARGLDIPDVDFVFNYDAPLKMDSYCHRIGRTGRNGKKGTAYTFLMPDTIKLAHELREFLEASAQEVNDAVHSACDDARQAARAKSRSKWDKRGGGRGGGGFGGRGGGGFGGGRGGGRGGGGRGGGRGYGGGGGGGGYSNGGF